MGFDLQLWTTGRRDPCLMGLDWMTAFREPWASAADWPFWHVGCVPNNVTMLPKGPQNDAWTCSTCTVNILMKNSCDPRARTICTIFTAFESDLHYLHHLQIWCTLLALSIESSSALLALFMPLVYAICTLCLEFLSALYTLFTPYGNRSLHCAYWIWSTR